MAQVWRRYFSFFYGLGSFLFREKFSGFCRNCINFPLEYVKQSWFWSIMRNRGSIHLTCSNFGLVCHSRLPTAQAIQVYFIFHHSLPEKVLICYLWRSNPNRATGKFGVSCVHVAQWKMIFRYQLKMSRWETIIIIENSRKILHFSELKFATE